jgi:type IV pilus assembly protein PilW
MLRQAINIGNPRTSQRGFTLVELMIAAALGLVLVLTMLASLQTSASINRSNVRTAELQTSGQFALEVLRRDLLHAGFKGLTYLRPDAGSPGAITSECAVGFVGNIGMGIWGANDSNPFAATCVPAAQYLQGDILVARRAALTPVTVLASNTIYLRSAYERGVVFRGNAPPTFTETPVQDYPVESFVYFVSPYTTSAAEDPLVPALYRARLLPGPSMASPELVATGIEHLQVQFGRTLTNGTTRYFDADALSAVASTLNAPSEWDEVHSVRLWLLARATTPEPGYTNTTTYAMGDQDYTVNDGFRRQLYTTVIMLRNTDT